MTLKKIIKSHLHKQELLITPRWEMWVAQRPELIVDEEIAQWMISELAREPRIRSGSFSGSGVGMCERRHVFTYLGVPEKEDLDSDKHMIFYDGHFRHLKWQGLMLQAGLLDEAEVPAQIDGRNTVCTIDGISTHPERGKHGVEFKGARDGSYSYVLNQGPMFKHLLQVHAYMLATDLDVWSLIYENKNSQEWKEFVIERDPEIITQVLDTLDDLNASVYEQQFPPILDKCKEKKGKYPRCPFRHICLDAGDWVTTEGNKLRIVR